MQPKMNATYPMLSNLELALIGIGRWGQKIAKAVSGLAGCRLAIACDRDPDRLGAAPLPATVQRVRHFEAVLADPRVQACILATPAALHAEQALRALAAGKHVFVEKPMALGHVDAQAISAAVVSSQRVLMVGHILQYDPTLGALTELAESGVLGSIEEVSADRFTTTPEPAAEGVWWSLAPHDVSFLLDLLSASPVEAHAAPLSLPGCRGEAMAGRFVFPSGAVARVRVANGCERRVRRLKVTGSKAVAVYSEDGPTPQLRIASRPRAGEGAANIGVVRPSIEPDGRDNLTRELDHFLDCIRTGRAPKTDHRQGQLVVEVLERALFQPVDRTISTMR